MSVQCFVGRFSDVNVPWPPISLNGLTIEEHLAAGSLQATGTPGIKISVNTVPGDLGLPINGNTGLFELHHALRGLTINSIAGGPVSTIGVVLARRFDPHPTAFGFMFDVGFGSAAGDPTFNAVPREGCAIFVDAIRDRRPNEADFNTQLAFTTIHELGHVFNLWHQETPLNFLATSPTSAPHPAGAFQFATDHRRFWAENAQTNFVLPGGSTFGRRGPGFPSDNNPLEMAQRTDRLRLSIDIAPREFWHFEPVELDVTVAMAGPSGKTMIPDVVDPGYAAFTIWIVRPDGTRRRYQPVAWFCENPGRQTITPNAPYRRDVSIFGQSGGYTFHSAGVHRVFCTLDLGRRGVLRSNAVEVDVKTAPARRLRYDRIAEVLEHRRHARLLFYKAARRPADHVEPLTDAASDLGRTPSAANIRYTVARAIMRKKPGTKATEQRVAYLLKRSLDSGQLTPVREQKACKCLETLEH